MAETASEMNGVLAARLSGLRQSQLGLRQAISAGQIRIAPEAAAAAAAACRRAREDLRLARLDFRYELDHRQLGDCSAGRGLDLQFRGKYDELVKFLSDSDTILENMAAAFEAAGRAYQTSEQANADNLNGKR